MSETPGPSFPLPFVAARDALTGRPTDHERHAIVRNAFMDASLPDRRVQERFERLETRYQLRQAAERYALTLDAVATALGLEHRSQLLPTGDERPGEAATITASHLARLSPRLQSDLERAQQAFDEARRCTLEGLADEIADFVRDTLKLDWPWLVLELAQEFFVRIDGLIWGLSMRIRYSAPPMVQEGFTLPAVTAERGEFVDEAQARLDEAQARLRGVDFKKGGRRVKEAKMARIAEWGTWFYRYKVNEESIAQLAREYHRSEHEAKGVSCAGSSDDRGAIRYGLQEARRLLELTQHTFAK